MMDLWSFFSLPDVNGQKKKWPANERQALCQNDSSIRSTPQYATCIPDCVYSSLTMDLMHCYALLDIFLSIGWHRAKTKTDNIFVCWIFSFWLIWVGRSSFVWQTRIEIAAVFVNHSHLLMLRVENQPQLCLCQNSNGDKKKRYIASLVSVD